MEWMLLPYRKLYRLIEGRSSRREFWMFVLLNVTILAVVLGLFFAFVGVAAFAPENFRNPAAMGSALIGMFALLLPLYIWALPTAVAWFAVTIRRMHDLNLSAWFYLVYIILSMIPIVNIIAFIGMIVLMCLPGSSGSNKYGPHPSQGYSEDVFS